MQRQENKYFLYFSVISVNLLTFSAASGFSWGSPSLPKLTSSDPAINPLGTPITIFDEAWVVSIYNAASILGSLVSGVVAESLGRKKTLVLLSSPMVIGYALMAFSTEIEYFFIARFLCGITGGTVFSVLPSYVGEISENENRGILGGVMGIMGAIGHLFSYAVGPFVSLRVFNMMQLLPLLLCYLTFLPFVPESAYYLLTIGKYGQAEECLKKLRGTESDVQKELLYISEQVEESHASKVPLKDVCSSRIFLKGLLVSCGLMFFQQFSGICAVLSYMQAIFTASGSTIPSHIAPILVAVIQLMSNVIIIFFVDRLGRKPLLILSSSGITIALTAMGGYFFMQSNHFDIDISWMPVCSLIAYMIFFNFGFAGLPWTICAEVFSPEVKSLGSSITTCVNLIIGCLITMIFPYMAVFLEMSGSFWLFGASSCLSIIFIVMLLPETKGKSSSEIQQILGGKTGEKEFLNKIYIVDCYEPTGKK